MCPFKCSDNFKQKENTQKVLIGILEKIEIICPAGCSNKIYYGDLKYHLNTCDKKQFACLGPNCKFMSPKIEMMDHVKKCETIFIYCELCSKKVKIKDMEMHTKEICGESIIECAYCKKILKRKLINVHCIELCRNEAKVYYERIIENKNNEIRNLKRTLAGLEGNNIGNRVSIININEGNAEEGIMKIVEVNNGIIILSEEEN